MSQARASQPAEPVPEAAPAAPAAAAAPRLPGAALPRPAALAGVLRAGGHLSNRAVAREAEGYGYGYADDPLNAGGFGPDDATIRVRPGPVRTTMIGGPAAPTQVAAAEEAAQEAPPAATGDEPSSEFRRLLMGEARAAVGATEFGGDKRFEALFGVSGVKNPESTLESARIRAGKKGATHTTCIDFQTVVYGRAREALQAAKLGKAPKVVTPMNAPTLTGWVESDPGIGQRPQVGDIYVLWKYKPPKTPGGKLEKWKFSHAGYIDKIERSGPVIDGEQCEYWTTIDGGQGSATTYDAAGHLVGAHGAEAVLRTRRVYIPSKNLITGEKVQDADMRLVKGWLDVDALVTAPTG